MSKFDTEDGKFEERLNIEEYNNDQSKESQTVKFWIKGRYIKNPTKEELAKYKPEEIIEFRMGNDNVVTEEWWIVPGYKIISFTYVANQDFENVNMMRDAHFKTYNIYPNFLKSYTAPKEYFDEITLLY